MSEPHEVSFLVDPSDVAGLTQWLRAQALLGPDETLGQVESAGEGNMNLTLRLRTEGRSFILKQSRPWVEKYPSIAAPAERAQVEAAFYQAVRGHAPLARRMPELLAVVPQANLLLLEDLGPASDFSDVYAGARVTDPERAALLGWLFQLHHLEVQALDARLHNPKMRALNHEHIFDLPLRMQDGLHADAFTPGLEAVAAALRSDEAYVAQVQALGARYLSARAGSLLHGDFYPGSWLRTANASVLIIDPEFCFVGPPEFDVGVMLAHAVLAGGDYQFERQALVRDYLAPPAFDLSLAERYAGVEIMRRLIGVAQLPLSASLDQKAAWLQLSRQLVLQ